MRKITQKILIVAGGLLVLLWIGTGVYSTLVTIPVVLGWLAASAGTLLEQLLAAFTWLLSRPFVLAISILFVGFVGAVVRNQTRDIDMGFGDVVNKAYEIIENKLAFLGSEVVRGSINHDDVRWIGHYKRSGRTKVEYRACLYHAIELEERTQQHTKAHRPNSPMRADEKTSEYEDRAWENISEREKVENEELVDALVCPNDNCSFSIPGKKRPMSDENAVRKRFESHFEQMQTGGSDPFDKWRVLAAEGHEFEPSPADIWDAYVDTGQHNDTSVMKNWSRLDETQGNEDGVTCEALKDYKQQAEGFDRFIELVPSGIDWAIAFLFRSEYVKKKREIKTKMNQERSTCQERLRHIEQEYGSTVERTVTARHNSDEPQIDSETAKGELNAASADVHELRDELRIEHTPDDMRRWLSMIENSISAAAEYMRELNDFEEHKEKIEPHIEEFEECFEPYRNVEEYMTTADQTLLNEKSSKIQGLLRDLHREVQLNLLPTDRMEWATEKKATFNERRRLLSDYNETFVERECERYEELFRTEHGSLNDEQQKAIVRNDHHNLVDASAGTGKTLTLTYRFLYLYRRGVPLDDIVAITFTNDAAEEMKERIADVLDSIDKDQLHISTYHSFANDIVEDSISGSVNTDLDGAHERYVEGFLNSDSEFKNRHQEAMTKFEEDHEAFLQADDGYIDKHKGSEQSREEFLCKQYTEFLATARNFDQTPDDISNRLTEVKSLQNHFGKAACRILGAFREHAKETDEPIDYQDMVTSATQLGEEASDHFNQEYQHILFDEFQDVDESVLDFVEMFLGDSGDTRLFAVGDDWQSIYGFKGSDPRYFIEFDERFEGVSHTQLAINYRCPPTIVEAGDELMANSKDDQNEKDVEAFSDSNVVPVAHKLGGIYENRAAFYAANLVEDKLSKDDTKPEDVMVLTHNDEQSAFMNRLRSHLDERGIPRIPVDNSDDEDTSNGVQTQSIYSSKGTEAEHVILANAIDDKYDGLPQQKKENELITPAIANPATHYAEERRLFYVAMTRTEHHLDVITHLGHHESRYLKEISSFFKEKHSNVWTVEGIVGPWDYSNLDNGHPITAPFACNGYKVELKTQNKKFARKLEAGGRYHLSNIDPENNGWGAKIKLDESVEIKEIES